MSDTFALSRRRSLVPVQDQLRDFVVQPSRLHWQAGRLHYKLFPDGCLQATGTAAARAATPAVLRGGEVQDDLVRIGHIGTGAGGWSLVQEMAASKLAEVVAVRDVCKPHVDRAVQAARNDDVKMYLDHRDLLADKNVKA